MDKINDNQEILIKVDQNNLIYIDPNSVIDESGVISPRNFEQDKLVMYANLEADIIPRSNLISTNDKQTLTSIARGTLNFLKNQNGGDYDTSWTDSFTPTNKKVDLKEDGNFEVIKNDDFFKKSDESGQSFGIDSINIEVKGANFVPQVKINFIDARGKTLFESPENSPYKAFFHIPWPIFYLTIKGYYGKAIRYRLHLVKFSSKFNESNGNFEIQTSFVGSTYAYLADLPLQGILNAPYLYIRETIGDKVFNPNTQVYDQKVSKSSKGYSILKSVYSEYKAKKHLEPNFPIKTLRELIVAAESLDKILEKQILDQVVDMNIFAGLKQFDTDIKNFEKEVRSWGSKRLAKDSSKKVNNETYYSLKESPKNSMEWITGSTKNGALEQLITLYSNKLNSNKLFIGGIINQTTSVFTKNSMKLDSKLKSVSDYYVKEESSGNVLVGLDLLVNHIRDVYRNFDEQRNRLEKDVETKMNEIVRDPTKGFGFEPTIKNIFAVILANADTYIRLMKDVHQRAIYVGEERKGKLKGYTDETPTEPIYPWPEVKKNSEKSKQNILAYPGDEKIKDKLQSNNARLWPEVEFVEEYISVSTNKNDPNSDEGMGINDVNFIFESNVDDSNILDISSFLSLSELTPYIDKTQVGLVYEIYERGFNSMMLDSYNDKMIKNLADLEFETIKESIKNDSDLITFLAKNVKSSNDLLTTMRKVGPIERQQYFQDQLPTTNYINELYNYPYKIEQFVPKPRSKKDNDNYTKFRIELRDFYVEQYRTRVFPFNSKDYLSYVNDNQNVTPSRSFNFNNYFDINLSQGFLSGPINPKLWIQSGVTTNIFGRGLIIGDTVVNILNTPYFQNQLMSDFSCDTTARGRYVGSAYLLLNSLPFLELENNFEFKLDNGLEIKNLRVANVFRELNASHYVPYHLLLKWGSIYHRYKKYINDGIDILGPDSATNRTGFTNTTQQVRFIDGDLFFNYNDPSVFTISGYSVSQTSKDVGINPFYQAIYSQIINDYNHYDIISGATSYTANTNNGSIVHNVRKGNVNELRYWTIFSDNEKFGGDKSYTLLPSDGGNAHIDKKNKPSSLDNVDTLARGKQIHNRLVWSDDDFINTDFSGKTFCSPYEYHRSFVGSGSTNDDKFEMVTNYRKVYDLIATFSPDILDDLEDMFIEFATEKTNQTVSIVNFNKVNYYKFQDLLKAISNIEKKNEDKNFTSPELFKEIRIRQGKKLEYITDKVLSNDNLIQLTIGNSKEYEPYILYGFSKESTTTKYKEKPYSSSQLNSQNQKLIKTYIGEYPESGYTTNYYNDFFSRNDIEISEDNIKTYRPLVYMYAGFVQYKKIQNSGYTPTSDDFKTYIRENVFSKNYEDKPFNPKGFNNRISYYFDSLTSNFNKLRIQDTPDITLVGGFNNEPLKLELYNYFKSFNDKWVAGNSLGQRILIEEFLFLDKANQDIGQKFFLNLDRLIQLNDRKNTKQNLYSILSMLLSNTGFDMRALPSYINFYGTNFSTKPKLTPSKKVAENIFGTFMDVDYQESSPKIIIQFVGNNSKRPDMSSEKYVFTDDSFNIANTSNNPILVTKPDVYNSDELSKSNKAVAFEISFGDQNQGIFKSVQLDQQSIKNTSESFVVLENLGRSESGAGAYNVDVSLFDYYRTASYQCSVSCMGNVMIQPTMFFYLKNVPMFKGTYWITEVSHSIKNNNIVTSFKGSRIPYTNLPDPTESFSSSYRVLFDKLVRKAVSRVQNADKNTPVLVKTVTVDGSSYTIDILKEIPNEKFVSKASLTTQGIPFNGFNNERYIQMVEHDGDEWLRAAAVIMGGPNYLISQTTHMSLIDRLVEASPFSIIKPKQVLWSDVQLYGKYYYETRFQLGGAIKANDILQRTTDFYNPKNRKSKTLVPDFQLDEDASTRRLNGPLGQGPQGTYGIAMSLDLMKELDLQDGDIVYFKLR